MLDSHSLNYSFKPPQTASIKVEPASLESAAGLLSPPSTPSSRSISSSALVSYTSSNLKRSLASPAFPYYKCVRPYRSISTRGVESSKMSHHYGSQWPHTNAKSEQGQRHYSGSPPSSGSSRRSGSGDQQTGTFGYADSYLQEEQYRHGSATHARSAATVTTSSSSLSGAMGDLGIPAHSPASGTAPSGMAWTPSPTSAFSEGFTVMSDDTGALNFLQTPPTPLSSGSAQPTFLTYDSYNTTAYSASNPTPPVGMPSSGYDQLAYQSAAMEHPSVIASAHSGIPMTVSPPPHISSPPISRSSRSSSEEQVRHLRRRIKELESLNKTATDRVAQLEHELARRSYAGSHASTSRGLPSPVPTPTFPTSAAFEQSWHARTEARKKLLCSLNRAGNALCAWHDSRRERRQYPPRNAPAGYLNCGCSYEEALFEESLARHGVGSYHPGESVRMDPALRNPLLKLLQDRYGYRDGDFERDARSGAWLPGDGSAFWENKLAAGIANGRKSRGEGSR